MQIAGIGEIEVDADPMEAVVEAAAFMEEDILEEDTEFTEQDLQAVEDCIFVLQSKPSHETVYNVLAEIGRNSSIWRNVFLLLDGLSAMAKPLLRCATGGERGPMHGEPYEEDLHLMGEIVHEVSDLMGELGMEVIVASRADLAKLRAE